MIVITAGRKYLDIDSYASMIAYRELLKHLSNEKVLTFSTVSTNQTVPPMLRASKYDLDTPVDTSRAKFILLDVSNPDFFDTFVDPKQVIEIIDHHSGYEEYWHQNKAVKSQIETIGAVCTQIYERFKKAGKTSLIDQDLAKLLSAGILDNTINLKSKMTTRRDHDAYQELKKLGHLSDHFNREYFKACEKERLKDLKGAILGDMKAEEVSSLLPAAIGQIILFNRNNITKAMLDDIFSDFSRWMINIISLEDGQSYLYCDSKNTQANLEKLFSTKSNQENLVVLDDFILRKEILKRAIEFKH